MSVTFIYELLIGSWLQGSSPLKDLPIIVKRSHASSQEKTSTLSNNLSLFSEQNAPAQTLFAPSEALHLAKTQYDVLKACCPLKQ